MDKSIVLIPRLSEKAYGLSQAHNTYVFDIPKGTNKHAVARAVQVQFEVTVIKVSVATIPGKTKRTVRKGGRAVSGRQNDVRKAYVTLKQGDNLPIFAALEEQAAKAEKAAQKETK